jgi:hypothetical protein
MIHGGYKELFISKGIHASVRLLFNTPNSEMDLENQMSNKTQGLFLLLLQDKFNTRGCYGIYSSDALLQKIVGSKLGSAFQFGYIQREPSKE